MNEQTRMQVRTAHAHAFALDEVAEQWHTRELVEEAFASRPDAPWLSLRELDVLDLVASGYSDKEIATRIGVSTATVNTHLRHVYAKLRANNRAHAVAIAIRYGLLQLPALG
jgi:DNA-binding CsgD family transcriptional regulator